MDTSILGTLSMIAPDLMREIELRTLVLERVSALEPIGRRALAQRLQLPEREVRSAADALRTSGCITLSAAGMELTDYGRSLVDTARAVSRGRRSLASMELALSHKLDVERVCIVRGDADMDESVLAEAAQTAARQIRFLLQDAQVLAVSGGETLRMTADAISLAAPMDVTVVPAQGGMGGPMDTQANVLAERFARHLGGRHRLLHLPEGISEQAAQELCSIAHVREALELLRHADVLLYGISCAQALSRSKRRISRAGDSSYTSARRWKRRAQWRRRWAFISTARARWSATDRPLRCVRRIWDAEPKLPLWLWAGARRRRSSACACIIRTGCWLPTRAQR